MSVAEEVRANMVTFGAQATLRQIGTPNAIDPTTGISAGPGAVIFQCEAWIHLKSRLVTLKDGAKASTVEVLSAFVFVDEAVDLRDANGDWQIIRDGAIFVVGASATYEQNGECVFGEFALTRSGASS